MSWTETTTHRPGCVFPRPAEGEALGVRGTSGIVLPLRFVKGLVIFGLLNVRQKAHGAASVFRLPPCVFFGLLPESIELGDAHGREVKVAFLSVRLDVAKARGELAGGGAQGILGVDAQVAADGGEGVQQV